MYFRREDPRIFQIAALFSMLCFGVGFRDFSVSLSSVTAVIVAALATQLVAIRLFSLPLHSLRSALITGLGVLLLARSNSLLCLSFAASLGIASKFILRWRGKHFFNPANFGILAAFLLTQKVWMSPAQWGEEITVILWLGISGGLVVYSAYRFDISCTFLLTYTGLLAGRVYYLGQNWDVLGHQLNNGALLLFTFFMISDPRSIPDHRNGRIVFAILVAGLAYVLRVYFYEPQAILWSLFALSPLTILLDGFWKNRRYEWRSKDSGWDRSPTPRESPFIAPEERPIVPLAT